MEDIDKKVLFTNRKAYPTILEGWGIILYTILASFIVGIFLSPFTFFDIDIKTGLFGLLIYALPIILVLFVVGLRRKKNTQNRKGYAFNPFSATILPFVFIVTIALALIIDSITGLVPMPEWLQEMFKTAFQHNVWGFITLAVAAPLLEELLMRGVVLEGLLRNYPPRKAIIWSAIFFGVLHLNPWQFVAGFISGCFIGWLYWKTDSLWPGIFVHFVNNTFCFLLMIFVPQVDNMWQLVENRLLYIGIVIICLLICWIGVVQINNMLNRKEEPVAY